MTEIILESGGWAIGASPEHLTVRRGTLEVARLTACPSINGQPTATRRWQRACEQHLTAALDIGGILHLAVDHGRLCYWMETPRVQLERLLYFPDGGDGAGMTDPEYCYLSTGLIPWAASTCCNGWST